MPLIKATMAIVIIANNNATMTKKTLQHKHLVSINTCLSLFEPTYCCCCESSPEELNLYLAGPLLPSEDWPFFLI
jgi:hypothetical protein